MVVTWYTVAYLRSEQYTDIHLNQNHMPTERQGTLLAHATNVLTHHVMHHSIQSDIYVTLAWSGYDTPCNQSF